MRKNMKMGQLLMVFKRNEEFLKNAGWIVSEPKSPRWWGGVKSPEEVAITAILVQLSTWTSVEKIAQTLRRAGLTRLDNLKDMEMERLEGLIRPVGLWKEKAKRLVEFATEVVKMGGLRKLKRTKNSRDFLLSINGIGKETADSITLFALNKPTIPVSNYIRVVLGRVGVIDPKQSYESLRRELTIETGEDILGLKLLYAGVTSIGRITCKKKPKCILCPLKEQCSFANSHSLY
jgi:endonuclease-3 related protein